MILLIYGIGVVINYIIWVILGYFFPKAKERLIDEEDGDKGLSFCVHVIFWPIVLFKLILLVVGFIIVMPFAELYELGCYMDKKGNKRQCDKRRKNSIQEKIRNKNNNGNG